MAETKPVLIPCRAKSFALDREWACGRPRHHDGHHVSNVDGLEYAWPQDVSKPYYALPTTTTSTYPLSQDHAWELKDNNLRLLRQNADLTYQVARLRRLLQAVGTEAVLDAVLADVGPEPEQPRPHAAGEAQS